MLNLDLDPTICLNCNRKMYRYKFNHALGTHEVNICWADGVVNITPNDTFVSEVIASKPELIMELYNTKHLIPVD